MGSVVNGAGRQAEIPPIRFAPARGARIAYQDYGQGPCVVAIPPLAQNIEAAWEWPDLRRMLERFGSFSRWVQFDKRGTGASDRGRQIPGLEERVEDMRAVMDHAGIDRAFLYGASEGGPMCILFAVTYPDRVNGLILHGTTASYRDPEATPEQQAELEALRMSLADHWGTPRSPIAALFSPSLADNDDYRQWMQRYERVSADQGSLVELLEIMGDFDVTDVLAEVAAPTLVLHRVDELIIPIKHGRELAAAIPDATLVELPGRDHFAFAGDQDWLLDLERFVTGTVVERSAVRLAPDVAIHTLGRFGVAVDGIEVPTAAWKSRIPREICKRLVAARGWPITRDELFEALWPDVHDRAKLGARLSVHLSAVRRVLRGGVIADRQTVALDLDEVTTDIETFFAAESDDEIVSLYTGDFLPEDEFEDWTRGVRGEARQRFTIAARNIARRAEAERDHDMLAEIARRLIDVEPFDETGHRMLVHALVGTDQLNLAADAHANWTRLLAEIDILVPPFRAADFA